MQSAVVSLAWDPDALEVFAADEFGFVKSYDLRPVIEQLVLGEAVRRKHAKRHSDISTHSLTAARTVVRILPT